MVHALKSKKATIDDLVYIMVVVATLSIFILISYKVVHTLNANTDLQDKMDSYGKNALSSIDNTYPTALDSSYLLLLVGLCIITLFLAGMVAVHPIFFIFYLVMLVIIVIIGGALSNVYQTFAEDPAFADLASNMTYMSHVMQYLPFIIGVFGFILAIIMYKNWETRQ
jgi:hypothetical protein